MSEVQLVARKPRIAEFATCPSLIISAMPNYVVESPIREVPDARSAALLALIESPTDTEIDEPESGFSTSPDTSFTSTSGESATVPPPHVPGTPIRPILVPEWVPTPQLVSRTAKTIQRTSEYGLRLILGTDRVNHCSFISSHAFSLNSMGRTACGNRFFAGSPGTI